MSENLDLVRSIYAAWERGDWSSAEWARPEIEFDVVDGPEPGVRTGVAAMAESWQKYPSAWEGYRSEADEYRELDDERILVFISVTGRGKTSGVDLEQMQAKGASVYHVQGGKGTRLVLYTDRERALADLGLEE